jgi:hypothetical protein
VSARLSNRIRRDNKIDIEEKKFSLWQTKLKLRDKLIDMIYETPVKKRESELVIVKICKIKVI